MNDDHSSCNSITDDTPSPQWVSNGGFFLLIVLVIEMFWGMAFICEEYSIPSITVFCKRNKISDDIAGSIYIGTGLSLPVLFASFVGLFASNTAIGVGTVVGGDIFNQMINIAVSIVVSPEGQLKISGLVTTREFLFYLLSCLLVIRAVHEDLVGSLRTAFTHAQWVSCLNIPWSASFILVMCYIIYVVVESYFDTVGEWCRLQIQKIKGYYQSLSSNGSVTTFEDLQRNESDIECDIIQDQKSQTQLEDSSGITRTTRTTTTVTTSTEETSESLQQNSALMTSNFPSHFTDEKPIRQRSYHSIGQHSNPLENAESKQAENTENNPNFRSLQITHPLPVSNPETNYLFLESARNDLLIERRTPPQSEHNFSTEEQLALLDNFILHIKSKSTFQCLPFNRQWRKRHFKFTNHGLYYFVHTHNNTPLSASGVGTVLNSSHSLQYINVFRLKSFMIEDIEQLEFSIHLNHPQSFSSPQGQTIFYFRAPDHRILNAVLWKLEWFQIQNRRRTEADLEESSRTAVQEIIAGLSEVTVRSEEDVEPMGVSNMFIPPSGWLLKLFYYFTLPLRLIFYYTIPNVKISGSENKAIVSTLAGFVWLAIVTYTLVITLGIIAVYLNINPIIMGYTIGAWAASYPALWSSVVVARNGYGDVAVCNVLGSNIFSNFFGLGFPWLIYSIIYGQNYSGIQDQGAAYSMLVLMFIAVAFYLLLVFTNFVLYSWMIPIFIGVYVGFTSYFIYFTLNL